MSYDGGVVITNVGDSRAYHISKHHITRVTKDHSLVERMVDDIETEDIIDAWIRAKTVDSFSKEGRQ